jgi:hypothetical protein
MKMDLPVKMKGMFVKLMMMIMAIQRAAPAKPCHKIMNNALYKLTYSIANVMMLETEQIWKNFPVNEKRKHQGELQAIHDTQPVFMSLHAGITCWVLKWSMTS